MGGSLRTYRLALLARDPHCCWCRCALSECDSTVDHLRARSKGGGNDHANLVLSCKPCNQARGAAEGPPGSLIRYASFARIRIAQQRQYCLSKRPAKKKKIRTKPKSGKKSPTGQIVRTESGQLLMMRGWKKWDKVRARMKDERASSA